MDEKLKRISEMEEILDKSVDATQALESAVEGVDRVLPEYRRLVAYYTSPRWMADFDDSREGRLPQGFKCGVLTEDAVYDTMTDAMRLAGELRRLADLLDAAIKSEEDDCEQA